MRVDHTGENKWLERIGLMIATPVIIMVGAVVILILSTPVMMAVLVVGFAMAILFAGTVVTRQTPVTAKIGEEAPMCESDELIGTLELETVEMVGSLDNAPRETVAAAITKVVGQCPLGMMPGNTWKIGPDGKLSRPMCRPGAAALNSLFRMTDGDAMDRSTCCECVFAGRKVTFTVREPVTEPA